jgi:hypothetical protein
MQLVFYFTNTYQFAEMKSVIPFMAQSFALAVYTYTIIMYGARSFTLIAIVPIISFHKILFSGTSIDQSPAVFFYLAILFSIVVLTVYRALTCPVLR